MVEISIKVPDMVAAEWGRTAAFRSNEKAADRGRENVQRFVMDLIRNYAPDLIQAFVDSQKPQYEPTPEPPQHVTFVQPFKVINNSTDGTKAPQEPTEKPEKGPENED